MFIKPQNDQVTVIFPMHFADARDAVIATQFLTQFAEVRRGQKELSTAPAVSYHKSPPLELKDAPEEMIGDANGGYVSFVLFKRHATPDRLEATVWNIMTFHAFVSYHIKYSKAYWHSRMRQKVESWLSIRPRPRSPTLMLSSREGAGDGGQGEGGGVYAMMAQSDFSRRMSRDRTHFRTRPIPRRKVWRARVRSFTMRMPKKFCPG